MAWTVRLPLRLWRIGRLLVHLLWGVILTLRYAGAPAPRWAAVICRWSAGLLSCLGVALRADPPPAISTGCLLVSNHVSWLDIYVILATRRVRFVSKAEVRAWPLVGWFAARTGTLFLEREKKSAALRIGQEIGNHLAAGDWVAVFPEGTTTDGRGMLPFRAFLLQAVLDRDAVVLPAAIRYRDRSGGYTDAAAYFGDMSLGQSLWRICGARGLNAQLNFATPLSTKGASRRTLAVQAETAVRDLAGFPVTERDQASSLAAALTKESA